MTNRVLIQTVAGVARMLVSMPGIDVTGTLTPDDVIFDDNFSGLDIMLQGSVAAGNSSTTINFGVTLVSPPLVLCYFDQNYVSAPGTYIVSPNAFIGSGYNDYFHVVTTVSQAVFSVQFGAVYPPFWYSIIRRRG